MKADHAQEIRRTLIDPIQLCVALGLTNGAKRQSRGLIICCPVHGDRTPSCSVSTGTDGTVRVRCFSCDFAGDALSLIAAAHKLDLRSDFKEVLLEGAQIGGLSDVIDEINGRQPYTPRKLPPLPEPGPERDYPPESEIGALWGDCVAVTADPVVTEHLRGRKLDPDLVHQFDLARAIEKDWPVPSWATFQGKKWPQSGHRIVVPVYDSTGTMRSVRAWRVEGDSPAKRLPPAGHRATGVVMANRRGRNLLRGEKYPGRILIVEGEPDFVTASSQWAQSAVFGIVTGSWGEDFAKRIAYGSEVVIMTHDDPAGNRYADQIGETLKNRAQVYRA